MRILMLASLLAAGAVALRTMRVLSNNHRMRGLEASNLVDGRRSVGEIRDPLAAISGAAPAEAVAEYLDVPARLGVLEAVR